MINGSLILQIPSMNPNGLLNNVLNGLLGKRGRRNSDRIHLMLQKLKPSKGVSLVKDVSKMAGRKKRNMQKLFKLFVRKGKMKGDTESVMNQLLPLHLPLLLLPPPGKNVVQPQQNHVLPKGFPKCLRPTCLTNIWPPLLKPPLSQFLPLCPQSLHLRDQWLPPNCHPHKWLIWCHHRQHVLLVFPL